MVKIELNSTDPSLPRKLKEDIEKTLLEHELITKTEVLITVKKQSQQNGGQSNENEMSTLANVKRIVAVASGKGVLENPL